MERLCADLYTQVRLEEAAREFDEKHDATMTLLGELDDLSEGRLMQLHNVNFSQVAVLHVIPPS